MRGFCEALLDVMILLRIFLAEAGLLTLQEV